MAEENKTQERSLLERFMKTGKITVFESGLDRPDYIQERPFFGLLEKGATTFIDKGPSENSLSVSSAEEKSEALTTEANIFFNEMEERFRTVVPGITLFIINPDAVQGRYLLDEEPNRSLGKSLFMHIEEKLQRANADNEKTFLTQEEIVKSVGEAAITGRSPFSMAASVSPTYDAIEGIGRVNLIVGDNPDSMSPNILNMVVGSDERMAKEGIEADEMRRLCLYHELGHATDEEYTGYSFDKLTQNDLSKVMRRHRTECIADAHAVLQLARDFGNTKAAALWGDCRIEYLRISVDRRLEDTKYDTDFIKKFRAAMGDKKEIKADDPEFEAKYKQLMKDKEVAGVIKELGSPLAYHTTDVVDAAIKYAQEHLADGSLQKMTDLEVVEESKRLALEHGLSRQQVAEISVSLAEGKKHPKYEEMMARCKQSRKNMPMSMKAIEEEYEVRRELNGYLEAAQLAANLGLPKPKVKFSPELTGKLMRNNIMSQQTKMMKQISLMNFQEDLIDTLEKGFSREEMHKVISEQKEALRKQGLAKQNKDEFAADKLAILDAVIDQAPSVQISLNATKVVKDRLSSIPSKTEVAGDAAIAHLIKNELKSLTSMKTALAKAFSRSPEGLTMEEQIEQLRSENKDFNKALLAEKETQVAAFAIRSDKETWNKVSEDPLLAYLVDSKARQKPAPWFSQYQMMAGMPDKGTMAALYQAVTAQHQELAKSVVENPVIAPVMEKKGPKLMNGLKEYVQIIKAAEAKVAEQAKVAAEPTKSAPLSPLNLKQAKIQGAR